MKVQKTPQTDNNESSSKKALALLLSFVLASTLMVPGIAYADDRASDGQNSSPASEGSENTAETTDVVDLNQGNEGDLSGEGTSGTDESEDASLTLSGVQESAEETVDVQAQSIDPNEIDTSWYTAEQSVLSISTAGQLKGLAKLVNEGNNFSGKTVNLTTSLTLTGEWTPIGTGNRSGSRFIGSPFSGVFDGNGYSITGLTLTTTSSKDYALGLFGGVVSGTVQNLTLVGVNVNVPTSEIAAAAIGMLTGDGVASNIKVSGSLKAARGNGAIVGRMTLSGTISDCTNNAAITGSAANVGGIVGAAYYTQQGSLMTISNCENNGPISGAGISVAGGIVGLSAANVSGCVNNGAVTAGSADSIGGIIGEQRAFGTISGNVNNATITGSMAGGIIGWIRYLESGTANYSRFDTVVVTGNTNYADIVGVQGKLSANGGIIAIAYDNASVSFNENYAPAISGYNFVAGIVGDLQVSTAPMPGVERDIIVSNNYSSTLYENLSGACVDLFAYNNDTRVFTVSDNTSSLVEKEITLTLDANGGSFEGAPTRDITATSSLYASTVASTTFTFPVAPLKSGSVLLGWFTAADGGEEVLVATAKFAENTTLYAHWGTIEQQVAEIEQKMDAVLEADAAPSVEAVNAVVESLVNANQATIDRMTTSEDARKIAAVESLFIVMNSNHVAPTSVEALEGTSLTQVQVEGAALSVPIANEMLHAQVDIKPVTLSEIPADLPRDIDTERLIPVDITLSIADAEDQLVEGMENIQPKAPLTLRIRVNNEDNDLDPKKILIVHYHDNGGRIETTAITPLSVTTEENDLIVTFMLTKLSKVVIGQLLGSIVDTPSDGNDNPPGNYNAQGNTTGVHSGVQTTPYSNRSLVQGSSAQQAAGAGSSSPSADTHGNTNVSGPDGTHSQVEGMYAHPTNTPVGFIVGLAALILGVTVALILVNRKQTKKNH